MTDEQRDDRYLTWSPGDQTKARGQTSTRRNITAYCGLGALALALALVLGAPVHWAQLIGALLLASVPAGAGVMCWVDAGDGAAQVGLSIVTSLALVALGSATMIWTNYWHPHLLMAVVSALAALSFAAFLASRRSGGHHTAALDG